MKLYFDVFTNDEIFSDSFPMNMLYQDVVCEIESAQIAVNNNFEVYKDSEEFKTAPAEGEEKAAEEAQKKNNVIDSFGFEPTPFSKPVYAKYIKEYLKNVKEHLEKKNAARIENFMAGAKEFAGWVMNNFGEFTFYTPRSGDGSSTIILSYIKEGKQTPTFLILMDGLRSEKI